MPAFVLGTHAILGRPSPSKGRFLLAPWLWPLQDPAMGHLAVGKLKDRPVLGTSFRGRREKSAGSLSQTGNKGILIITMSTGKTTSFLLCFMLLVFKALHEYLAHSNSTISETRASPGASDPWLAVLLGPSGQENLLGQT